MRIALVGGIFDDPMGLYAPSAPESVLARALETAGLDVARLPTGRRPRTGGPFDLYHVHHYGRAAYELVLAGEGPLVFTPHNGFLLRPGHATTSRVEHALELLVLKRADVVVALSQREADTLAGRYGVARERLRVIPNGVEVERYKRAAARGRDVVELLSVGQLIDVKGHGFLLEAMGALVPRFPELRLRLVSHNDALRPRYEARCAELGIADRVAFEGPLGPDELLERYRACDVFVQPSLVECFPVTILEAMASGVPVVATDVGGVPEEIGEAGIVVPPADSAALAAAIEQFVVDVDERLRRGARAMERVRENFRSDQVAARHLLVYQELAGRPRQAGILRRTGASALVAAYGRRGSISRLVPRAVRQRRVRNGRF